MHRKRNWKLIGVGVAWFSLVCCKETIRQDPSSNGGQGVIEAQGKECPQGKGAPMVKLSTPKGVSYCMDRTEVTRSQYAEFLASNKENLVIESPYCQKFNHTYQPKPSDPNDPEPHPDACPDTEWDPVKGANLPVRCVDLCDARAYCQWVGKRLCGKIGGGPLPKVKDGEEPKALLDPEVSQWYNACSQGGKTKFAYGDKADPSRCPKDSLEVEAFAETCHGQEPPFDQILNLSAGFAEIEDIDVDAQGPGSSSIARGVLGGSPETSYRCDSIASGSFQYAGFRCCADL